MSGTLKPLASRRTRDAYIRKGLFRGYWYTLEGRKIRRVRRSELAEAYRLRAKHGDLL